jgi:hypothetical protein
MLICRANDTIDVLMNNDKYLKIRYTVNGKLRGKENAHIPKYTINFLDSYLLIPASLARLATQFGVEGKGDFNVKDITNNTNFVRIKNDLLKYNQQDCRILYKIIQIYSKLNVQNLGVNIFQAPTAAANEFKIFRTAYLDAERDKISITSKDMFDLIKPGYFGGAVDVYKPANMPEQLLSYYDVNSLYPSVMAKYPMPTEQYRIIRDSRLNLEDPNLVAFVKCNVTTPDNILVPILLKNVDGKSGTGTWTGTYYSLFLSKFFVEHKKLRFANAKRSHGFYSSNGGIKTLFSSSPPEKKINFYFHRK